VKKFVPYGERRLGPLSSPSPFSYYPSSHPKEFCYKPTSSSSNSGISLFSDLDKDLMIVNVNNSNVNNCNNGAVFNGVCSSVVTSSSLSYSRRMAIPFQPSTADCSYGNKYSLSPSYYYSPPVTISNYQDHSSSDEYLMKNIFFNPSQHQHHLYAPVRNVDRNYLHKPSLSIRNINKSGYSLFHPKYHSYLPLIDEQESNSDYSSVSTTSVCLIDKQENNSDCSSVSTTSVSLISEQENKNLLIKKKNQKVTFRSNSCPPLLNFVIHNQELN
jgi:hypothetical protein